MEGAPRNRQEIISESSEVYQEFKTQMQERSEFAHFAFGERFLATREAYREEIRLLDKEIEEKQQERGDLKELRAYHVTKMELGMLDFKKSLHQRFDEDFPGYVTFFTEISQNSHIMELVNKSAKLKASSSKEIDPVVTLCTLFCLDKIPDEVFEEMVKFRVSLYVEKQREFEMRLPELLVDFREAAIKGIKDGWLPIDNDLLERRMADINIYLADSMDKPEDVGGDYDTRQNIIRIFEDTQDVQKHSLFHELIHGLGGKTIVDFHREGKEIGDSVAHRRVGLHFNAMNSKGEVEQRFRWLDEAVTEEITVRLLDQEKGVYLDERRDLEKLYNTGVSQDLVYRAYFENYNPEDIDKIPGWKKLMQNISESQGNIGGAKTLLEIEKEGEFRRLKDEIENLKNNIRS
jgi:hypothetical protein